MSILKFNEEEIWDIFKLLAAILHLGNVKFTSGEIGECTYFTY